MQDDDLLEGHNFNSDYTVVERVVMARGSPIHGRPIYFVKWQGLGYYECTWEEEQGLKNAASLKAHNAHPMQAQFMKPLSVVVAVAVIGP